jgi:hypothetical protein
MASRSDLENAGKAGCDLPHVASSISFWKWKGSCSTIRSRSPPSTSRGKIPTSRGRAVQQSPTYLYPQTRQGRGCMHHKKYVMSHVHERGGVGGERGGGPRCTHHSTGILKPYMRYRSMSLVRRGRSSSCDLLCRK